LAIQIGYTSEGTMAIAWPPRTRNGDTALPTPLRRATAFHGERWFESTAAPPCIGLTRCTFLRVSTDLQPPF
jgi:hypothetical protein